jgi:hypothetical protein
LPDGSAVGGETGAAAYRPPKDVPPAGIGFRGDGTGVYPSSKPPVEWDEAAGRNIVWKAELPNWGYSSPVPVGNRVLVMTEPGWKSLYPQLNCYDAETGRLLWQRDVNPFDAFPNLTAEQRASLADDIRWVHEGFRAAYRICAPLEGKGRVGRDDPALKPINDTLAGHGMKCLGFKKGYGLLRYVKYIDRTNRKQIDRRLKPYGVRAETTWQRFGHSRVGAAFPTPVTDGRNIWVVTGHGTVACFDMDGRHKWSRYGYRHFGNTELMASPRLWGRLLLAAFIGCGGEGKLIAYDKAAGETKWQADINGGGRHKEAKSRSGGALLVMTIGRAPVVLCSTGRVVRLPDGKVYDAPIDRSCGTYAVDDAGDSVFGTGSHDRGSARWGVRLAIEGGELKVADRFKPQKGNAVYSHVFADGRLLAGGAQIDPDTGLPLGMKENPRDLRKVRTAPDTRHLLLVANGHVYGARERGPNRRRKEKGVSKGICQVYTLDGRKVAENVLLSAPLEGPRREKWRLQGFGRYFSFACSMNIGGDRLYICSQDYLYCIGERKRDEKA